MIPFHSGSLCHCLEKREKKKKKKTKGKETKKEKKRSEEEREMDLDSEKETSGLNGEEQYFASFPASPHSSPQTPEDPRQTVHTDKGMTKLIFLNSMK